MIKTKRTNPIEAAEQSTPKRRSTGAWLAVGMIALAFTGCRSADVSKRQEASNTPLQNSTNNPTANKSDFHKDVSPEQGFNVHVELARAYESQSNFEAAVAEYEKAVEMCEKRGSGISGTKLGPPQRALAERRLGAAYDRMGKFTQSEVHYGKAMNAMPKDSKVWNDVGYSYYLQNRLADAERSFKTADSIDPSNPRVLTNLGLTLAAEGKNEEALAALSRAGGPAVGQANLGFILAAMGKTAEARTHYEAALTAQPEMNAARQALTHLDLQSRSAPVTSIATNTGVTPVQVSPPAAGPVPSPALGTVPTASRASSDIAVVSASAPNGKLVGTRIPLPMRVPVPIAVIPVSLPVRPLEAAAPAMPPIPKPATPPATVPKTPAPAPAPAPSPAKPAATSAVARPANHSVAVVPTSRKPVDRPPSKQALPKLPPELEDDQVVLKELLAATSHETAPFRDTQFVLASAELAAPTVSKKSQSPAPPPVVTPTKPAPAKNTVARPSPKNPTPPTPW